VKDDIRRVQDGLEVRQVRVYERRRRVLLGGCGLCGSFALRGLDGAPGHGVDADGARVEALVVGSAGVRARRRGRFGVGARSLLGLFLLRLFLLGLSERR
jgi:hypothetical protein